MNLPQRIQLRRTKGWRMPANTLKVDRSTKWGNPFIIGEHGDQTRCVQLFALLMKGLLLPRETPDGALEYRARSLENLHELRGKNLGCWCRPGTPCHADILIKLANS